MLGVVGASQAGGISLPGGQHSERRALPQVAEEPATPSRTRPGQRAYGRSKYRGFGIRVRSYQLAESSLWTGDLDIRRKGRWQPFRVDERYQTEQEAYARCSDLARRIIDGEVPGRSVEHLRHAHAGSRSLIQAWRHKSMRPVVVLGIVILGLGAFMLLRLGGVTSRRDVSTLGAASLVADGQLLTADEPLTFPPWAGGASIAVGAALIVFALRKRS